MEHRARGRVFPGLKHSQLKCQAMAFYSEHKIQDAVESLLNEMFLSEPEDVYGYMSEYFHGLALQPVISSLSVYEGLDCAGGKSLELDLYCTVHGMEKLMASTSLSLDMYDSATDHKPLPPSSGRGRSSSRTKQSVPSLDQGALTSSQSSTAPAISVINGSQSVSKYIAPAVKKLSPLLLEEVDEALSAITAQVPNSKLHPSALLATSCATVMAGAQLSKTPLFLHLAKHCGLPPSHPETPVTSTQETSSACQRKPYKFTLPVPVVGAIAGGHLGCGKCRFKEFCLSPLPGVPFPEQVQMIIAVYRELGKCLTTKYGNSAQGCLVSGAYCPVIDKPETALDFLQEAANNAEFELNKSIGIIVDVGADKLYDKAKAKYELISGQWKSTDDVISVYSDLLRSYPGLLGFVDPLHHYDVEGWKKLQDKLGNNCFLIADNTLRKGLPITCPNQVPESIVEESSEPETADNANVLVETDHPSLSYLSCGTVCLEATLSQTMSRASHIKEHSYYLMLRAPSNYTLNTLPADLAVALMCRFIRMGAPNGLTSSGLLSRLIRIREELTMRRLHNPAEAHVFTSIPEDFDQIHD